MLSTALSQDVIFDKKEADTYLLAQLIDAECGDDKWDDQMLYNTGSVVLNRVEHDAFPDSIEKVIYQVGQYAVVDNGRINREPRERPLRIATELMENGSMLPRDVIYQANFKQGSEVYCQVQNMYFCKR